MFFTYHNNNMILLIQKLNVEKYLGIVYKIHFTHGWICHTTPVGRAS
jgi:hypothetical protein